MNDNFEKEYSLSDTFMRFGFNIENTSGKRLVHYVDLNDIYKDERYHYRLTDKQMVMLYNMMKIAMTNALALIEEGKLDNEG